MTDELITLMQDAVRNYLEPCTYIRRRAGGTCKHDSEVETPWDNHADSQVRLMRKQRDEMFIGDMIYFLDSEEHGTNTRTPTPAAPQTGYSWTNSAPQGAPETLPEVLAIHPNALKVSFEGRGVLTPPAQIMETGEPLPEYTLKATSDARRAALQAERDEDANQLDSARHTVDVLTARIATARNEALEEAAKQIEHAANIRAEDGENYTAVNLREEANGIRALKTPEGDG